MRYSLRRFSKSADVSCFVPAKAAAVVTVIVSSSRCLRYAARSYSRSREANISNLRPPAVFCSTVRPSTSPLPCAIRP